jgi:hypothetical protein
MAYILSKERDGSVTEMKRSWEQQAMAFVLALLWPKHQISALEHQLFSGSCCLYCRRLRFGCWIGWLAL